MNPSDEFWAENSSTRSLSLSYPWPTPNSNFIKGTLQITFQTTESVRPCLMQLATFPEHLPHLVGGGSNTFSMSPRLKWNRGFTCYCWTSAAEPPLGRLTEHWVLGYNVQVPCDPAISLLGSPSYGKKMAEHRDAHERIFTVLLSEREKNNPSMNQWCK